MQLFICSNFQVSWNQLIIKENQDLLNQLRKVLRAQAGYEFFVQSPSPKERYHLSLQSWTDQLITANILEILPIPPKKQKVWMLIALPNKQEKLELIVQKLSEIGVDEIFLWASERSVLKSLNPNKEQRLLKIIKEATEQSWSWVLPKLTFLSDIKPLHENWQFVVFDLPNHKQKLQNKKSDLPLLWVIGPEGGLTEKDYSQFPEEFQIDFLGEQVLRMETAAIIGGWKLKQYI